MVFVKEEMVDVGLHSIGNGSGTVRLCSIWFDLVRKSNRIELLHKFRVRFCSITEPNRTYSFD